ncbi:MAG: hypothetical protein KGL39_59430 [Patescibacteria group bacterium]|nr:hypothetical protein [Patescibacteria group bacterium]
MNTPQIIAIGDSHMDYPTELLTGGGIPAHFTRLTGIPVRNIAHHGDGSEVTLSLRKRKEIEESITGTDIMLVSMGGDDIAGDQFCLWLKDNETGNTADAVDWPVFNHQLDLIMACYADLTQIRNIVNPDCLIVTYEYDFPTASKLGVGVCGLGPWLKPSLDFCGWLQAQDQVDIIKVVLTAFSARLRALVVNNRVHVETQGTCGEDDWQNEIHYNRHGFGKIAAKFVETLAPSLAEFQNQS